LYTREATDLRAATEGSKSAQILASAFAQQKMNLPHLNSNQATKMQALLDWMDYYGKGCHPENLPRISELNVCNRQITSIPPEISLLTNLTYLNFSNNKMLEIPVELCNLTSLSVINLDSNQISTIPPEIGKLTKLTILDISHNQLETIPPEIGLLTNLTQLYLYDNKLTSLPPELGNLRFLRDLDLEINNLSTLPYEMVNLSNLDDLDLGKNEWRCIPYTVIELVNNTPLSDFRIESDYIKIPQASSHQGFCEFLHDLRYYILVYVYYHKWRSIIIDKRGPKDDHEIRILQRYLSILG